MHDLEIASHREQYALQAPCHQIDTPSAPTFAAESERQTACPDEAARSLYAHHWNAETPDSLEHKRGIYLREILDRCKNGREDPEEVGPALCMLWPSIDKPEAQYGDNHGVQDRDGGYAQCSLVRWCELILWRIVLVVVERIGSAREEDEE